MAFEHMTTEELGNWVSDFYKDLNGFRPRHFDFSNREQLIDAANHLDDEFESLKSTIDGRQYLREMGFYLPTEEDSVEPVYVAPAYSPLKLSEIFPR